MKQSDIVLHGHAIECRINAENPTTFRPSPGKIATYLAPGGLGVRVDSALYQGYVVPPHYDSLVAKLILHGAEPQRMHHADAPRARGICHRRHRHDDSAASAVSPPNPTSSTANYDVHWLERFVARTAP